ncbi:MAG: TatD family nuclease-associated radical SAM protein [Bacillota bacterium]
MVIAYPFQSGLYLNITNRCTNACRFCLRREMDGVGGYSLWLAKEPDTEEIVESIRKEMHPGIAEVVFCGYGEPLLRPEAVAGAAEFVKRNYPAPVRVNTNGLANAFHGRNIIPKIAPHIDCISVSLNAENARKYQELCRPSFGLESYGYLLDFIRECKKNIPRVIASAVYGTGADLDACRAVADDLGAEFRIRQRY